MTEPSAPGGQSGSNLRGNSIKTDREDRLESWGEIANYLGRDIRTVQRWERDLGLPIHRLKTAKLGQVYAYRTELDEWKKSRAGNGNQGYGERNWKLAVAVLGVAALVVVIWVVATSGGSGSGRAPKGKTLLFVRPFESVSNGPEETAFAHGLMIELITGFGKAKPERLAVLAPTTSMESGKKSIRELRVELNADEVLEGSVWREGDRVRINVTLVSANDQKTEWTNSYTTDMKDLLQSQDDVVRDVVAQITGWMESKQGVALGDSRPKTPIDPEAYEAYIKARVYALDRDIVRARSAYDLALQRSPDFAPVQAGLALTLLLEGQSPNDLANPRGAVPVARMLAQKALDRDKTLGDAYCVLANIAQTYDYNPAEAERLYQEAMRVDPSNMTAHEWYGNYFMIRNHMDEAEREVNKGRQLDPAAPLLNTQVAEIKYYRRQYDAVLEQADRILKEHPNFVYARLWKASALREQKRYDEALKEFEELRRETNSSPASIALQGHALGVSGDRAGALKNLHELEALQATRYVPSLYLAAIYLGVNDRKATIAKLKEAYQERYDRLVYINVDPMADSLHGDPEFEQLMQKVGVK